MNPSRLFRASCIALIVTAMSFALRGAAAASWASEFHLSNEQVGWINLTAFWGFTLAMIFGGPLCDAIGLKKIAVIAFLGHALGIALTVFAWDFWSLFVGTAVFGIANGSVEAACNPLIATIYPNDKTTKLNHFHVWFPGGIVIGGVVAYLLGKVGLGWKAQFVSLYVPLAIYGLMFLRQEFPKTERVQQGVSTGAMWAECVRPGFLLMALCMIMTAATELGPQQWVPNIFTNAGYSGPLVLSWITLLMALGRQFAGPFVHRLSPSGMLVMSSALSAAGLFLMSHSSGPMLLVAATVFAFGVCFFWPTMLGFVSENYPKTGALGLAVMGGIGMLSAGYMVPLIGKLYDQGIAARLPAGADPATASAEIQSAAGFASLGKVAFLPVILTVVFILIAITRKKNTDGTAKAHA